MIINLENPQELTVQEKQALHFLFREKMLNGVDKLNAGGSYSISSTNETIELTHAIYKNCLSAGVTEYIVENGEKLGAGSFGCASTGKHVLYDTNSKDAFVADDMIILPQCRVIKSVILGEGVTREDVENESLVIAHAFNNSKYGVGYGRNQFYEQEAYIFMNLAIGTTLATQMKRREFYEMPIEKRFRIGLNLLEKIINLHKNNFVHRDLKPDNIILDPANLEIQLIDTGQSEKIKNDDPHKKPTYKPGTHDYLPEGYIQQSSIPANSPGIDVYSFLQIFLQILQPSFVKIYPFYHEFHYTEGLIEDIDITHAEVKETLQIILRQIYNEAVPSNSDDMNYLFTSLINVYNSLCGLKNRYLMNENTENEQLSRSLYSPAFFSFFKADASITGLLSNIKILTIEIECQVKAESPKREKLLGIKHELEVLRQAIKQARPTAANLANFTKKYKHLLSEKNTLDRTQIAGNKSHQFRS